MSVISTGKLEGLLDASITLSVLGEDSYRENLRCALLPYTLIQHLELVQQLSNGNENFDDEKALEATRAKLQHVRNQRLKGMEAFALDYAVEWPISLVISRKELTKYQLVFRHLFFCNHVQRQLSKTWLWASKFERNGFKRCLDSVIHFTTKNVTFHAKLFVLYDG